MKLELSQFDAVAFDFDGTLANTIPVHTEGGRYAFAHHGVLGVTEEQHILGHLHGTTPHTVIAGMLKEASLIPFDADPYTHELVNRLVSTKVDYHHLQARSGFEQHPGSVEMYKLMVELMGAEHVSIVTTATLAEVTPFTQRYDLAKYLTPERTITVETVQEYGLRLKPYGDAYILAASRMGVEPGRLLVVEDSAGGVASGKRATGLVLAVGTTNAQAALYDLTLEYHPDLFAESFADIELVRGR